MSDGPYRGLPMQREWKKVAECAGNPAVSTGDMRARVDAALGKNWSQEVSSRFIASIRHVFKKMALLGRDETIKCLESCRQSISGRPMGHALLDYLICAIGEGKSEEVALQEAATHTLIDRVECSKRQIEEYYLLEENYKNEWNACQRLEEVIQLGGFRALAYQLLNFGSKSVRQIKKHDNLDDGVEL